MKDKVSQPATRTAVQPVQAALDLSILIPVFNEEESLRPLYENLTRVLGTLKESYEILIVDDGSTDGSLQVMRDWRVPIPGSAFSNSFETSVKRQPWLPPLSTLGARP